VEVLRGVRQMRFEGLFGQHERGELSRRKRRTCWGVGGAVQALADRPRDEGPERSAITVSANCRAVSLRQ
jgi:hypothetical protein